MSQFETVFRSARVADGLGTPIFTADVAVTGGKIAAIGRLNGCVAGRTIDATGLVLSPGFIDVHGHSEYALLVNPRAESKVHQGITTEVCGNCGFSPGPFEGAAIPEENARIEREYGIRPQWRRIGEFLEILGRKRLAMNVGTLAGHGVIRAGVVGYKNRPATPEEFARMRRLLEEALDDGAFGFSTGLIYVPSSFGDFNEIVGLASVMARKEGIYTSHIRGEGETVFQAVEEALRIGERSGVPVQVSHLKVGKAHWGKAPALLGLFEEARARGIDVAADQYPYTASCTGLSAALPLWAREGTDAEIKARLADPIVRRKAVEETSQNFERSYEDVLLSHLPPGPYKGWEGERIRKLAEAAGKGPGELLVEMVADVGESAAAIYFSMNEDDVAAIMRWPHTFVATDAEARAPDGILGEGTPHPRTYGTYPRVLGRYVRERGILPLETAVRKMTGLPAEKFGLTGRGTIREGNWADLVLFDPELVADRASYEHPKAFPVGIVGVWVNGEEVVRNGTLTGAAPGRVLRRGAP